MSFLAYKGFEQDLTCRGFQYEVGKTYEMEGEPVLCSKGFHCCKYLHDVFRYYPTHVENDDWLNTPYHYMRPIKVPTGNRYCVVEVFGQTDAFMYHDSKVSTNRIRIVKELTEAEIQKVLLEEDDNYKLDIRRRLIY